jgi:hypothetical protein
MTGLVPGIHVVFRSKTDVDGRDNRAFTPVFDGPCPATTRMDGQVVCYSAAARFSPACAEMM